MHRKWGAIVASCVVWTGCREANLLPTPDGGGDGGIIPTGYRRKSGPNPIPAENQRSGDPAWQSGRQPYAGQVLLYASKDSLEVGDTIDVRVSTDVSSSVTATVYRLGYYGGAGARAVWTGGPFSTTDQGNCPMDGATGLVECHWKDTFSFQVGSDWLSGIYVIKVARPDNFRGFTHFVVRDHRAAELLFQRAINTDQAYNAFQGESLYADASRSVPGGFATVVSFDRPFAEDDGVGFVDRYEYWMVRFLEQNGYDVSYGTNVDLSRFGDFVAGVGAFISAGHDEYWDQAERDQVDAALAGGESVAYFGANGGYWRTRYEPNAAGEPFRRLVCYKVNPALDPLAPYATKRYRDIPNPQPENELFGVMYSDWLLAPFSLVVADPNHWLFEGTGLGANDQLYGIAGYEYDRAFDDGAAPPGTRHALRSPTVSAEGVPDLSQSADYNLPGGNIVFAAGTIYWSWGLSSDPSTHDGRVERMTLNVLEHALAHVRPARPLPPATGPIPTQGPTVPVWAKSVAAFSGAPGDPSSLDGPSVQARFNGPTGVAVLSTQQVAVADTLGNQIRLIDTDASRMVRTIAGNGNLGLINGPGAQATFRRPTAVVQAPDGSLLVADSDNDCIRQVGADASWTVSTYAGGNRQPGNADGIGTAARFNRPTALAIDALGNLYVADQVNNRIRKIAWGTRQVTTLAGSAGGYQDAAVGTQARFNNPSAIALGPAGELYVFDAGNQVFRAVSSAAAHAVTTLAGAGDVYGYADGPGPSALFRAQMGLAVGSLGEVIVGDTANNRLRKVIVGVDAPSTKVYTIAGSGALGTNLGAGDAANIVAPAGLAYLPDGRILVSDSYNNVIRIVTR